MASLYPEPGEGLVVGKSAQMQDIFEQIQAASCSTGNVLITGESGTGKELVARFIHQHSGRSIGPFVPVNCGAIPKELFESELFGHVKGAFTGAVSDTIGLFRAADGGTLFLDEVAEIPPEVQVKLLRVLQDKRIRSLGNTLEMSVDVRVIAATNRNIEFERSQGTLREDFYYRLGVVTFCMPPLRERPEDIPALVDHFIRCMNKRFDRHIESVAPVVLKELIAYAWPGNVRQLENVIENAFLLTHTDQIQAVHLEAPTRKMGLEPPSDRQFITSIPEMWFLPAISPMLARQIRTAAQTRGGVLIFGEEGTGSRLVAKQIHMQSVYAKGPFVVVYCSAIDPGQIGKLLFGETEGGKSGKGYVQQAEGGTLYLREITAVPKREQLLLVSLLDENIFPRPEGVPHRKPNLHVIGNTSEDVDEALSYGRLNIQLYARLSAFSIYLPSLREQRARISEFADHYIEVFCRRQRRENAGIDDEALACLTTYAWPGNLLEMIFVLQGALFGAQFERIQKHHLPDRIRLHRAAEPRETGRVKDMERTLLHNALHAADGNKVQAAQILGVSRNRLYRMLREDGGK